MTKKNSILFVDDEEDVLNSLKRQFRKADYKLYTAVGGDAALKLLESETVEIIITDERMPGMTGIELLQKVKLMYPDTIRIILSGYADSMSIISAINMGEVYRFITKPWSKEEMLEIIEQAFLHYSTIQQNKKNMQYIIEENKQLHKNQNSRESNLEITRDILDILPTPVLIITHDDKIAFFNSEAAKIQDFDFKVQTTLTNIFPEKIAAELLRSFKLSGGQNSVVWERGNEKLILNTRVLRPTDSYKGLIFIE